MILALVVFCVQLLVIGCSCPEGFESHGPKCYHFSHDKEAFFMGQFVCEQLGGHLAEIETADESTFLSTQVKEKHYDHYWIGLTDLLKEGEWRWHTTGEVLSANISNWDTNEPDNWNPTVENCVEIKLGGKWGDAECMLSRPYICETYNEEPEIVG